MKIEDAKVGMKVYDTMHPKQIGTIIDVAEHIIEHYSYKPTMYVTVKFDDNPGDPGSAHLYHYDQDVSYLREVKA